MAEPQVYRVKKGEAMPAGAQIIKDIVDDTSGEVLAYDYVIPDDVRNAETAPPLVLAAVLAGHFRTRGELIIGLDTNYLGDGQKLMYLKAPGKTRKSAAVNILPNGVDVLVGESWQDLLRALADAIDAANEELRNG